MWAFDYVGGIPSAIQVPDNKKNILKLALKFFLGGLVDSDVLNVDDFVVFGNEISVALSNVQLVKEKLEKMSKHGLGLIAKRGRVGEVKLSIAWKDIFSGALCINISNVEIEAEMSQPEQEEVFFDALSESIYESVRAVGDLEGRLEEEVVELLVESESSESSSSSDGSMFDVTKTVMKNIIRDVSVSIKGIRISVALGKITGLLVEIARVELEDDTEEIKASESPDLLPHQAIYVAKSLRIDGLQVSIVSNGCNWPLLQIMSEETEDQSPTFALEFIARLYKDRRCEIEGWTGEMKLIAAPEYIQAGSALLRILANGRMQLPRRSTERDSSNSNQFITVAFLKVEIGTVQLYLLESPVLDLEEACGYRFDLLDSIVSRFNVPSSDQQPPLNLVCDAVRISRLGGEEDPQIIYETENSGLIKITLDQNGVRANIEGRIGLFYDANILRLQHLFMSAFESLQRPAGKTQAYNASDSAIQISVTIQGVDFALSEEIIPDCTGAKLTVDDLHLITGPLASSLSFQKAELQVNGSQIVIDSTTLTRKSQEAAQIPENEMASAFDPVMALFDGDPYLHVSSADQSSLLHEQLQMAAVRTVVFSSRGVKLVASAKDIILLQSAGHQLKAGAGPAVPTCLTGMLSLLDIEILMDQSAEGISLKLMLCDASLLACTKVERVERIVDFRADVVSISREHQLLARRILNLSFDNSFKNIVFTAARQADEVEARISMQIAGLEVKLPLRTTFKAEKEFMKAFTAQSQVISGGHDDSQSDPTYHLAFYKCSMSPEFPKTWPRCFPSALFADYLRLVMQPVQHDLKAFLTGGLLFLARRHRNPAIPGIYEEGFTYWQEHGYAPVCRLDFLKMHARRDDSKAWTVDMENQEVSIEVREDSAHIVKHFFDYLSNMSRYGASNVTSQDVGESIKSSKAHTPKDPRSDIDIDEDFFRPAASSALDFATIEENDDWGAVLDLPTTADLSAVEHFESEEELSGGSTFSSNAASPTVCILDGLDDLDLDEEYYTKARIKLDYFPFAAPNEQPEGLRARLCLHDFNIRLKLVEGSHFRDLRRKSSLPAYMQSLLSNEPLSYGVSPTDAPLSPTMTCQSSFRDDISKISSPSSHNTRWSKLPPMPPKVVGKADEIEIVLERINMEVDWTHRPEMAPIMEAVRLTVASVEILDQVKSSKWKTVLTRRRDAYEATAGPETESMLRCRLEAVNFDECDAKGETSPEYNLKVRMLPIRVHLDQDTLLFITRFTVPLTQPTEEDDNNSEGESESIEPAIEPLFFQHCDIGKISLRIDYKPKHIDFNRLRLGGLGEFVNFFQLEGAELLLPAASLRGIKGSNHFCSELLKAWLPYVQSTQVPRLVKGIAPVRTAVSVGGGFADLVLLPMQDWKREGRLLRGLKEGAASLLHATALEGARIGTRLAVGTQVILEHVDDIFEPGAEEAREGSNRSRYADPPESLQEGLITAYKSLSSSLADGLHTIIAVPVQVYERSGPEGALKAAIRAVPVAVLKPAIGASEAISRTLMGVESALDPGRGIDIKRKYK